MISLFKQVIFRFQAFIFQGEYFSIGKMCFVFLPEDGVDVSPKPVFGTRFDQILPFQDAKLILYWMVKKIFIYIYVYI